MSELTAITFHDAVAAEYRRSVSSRGDREHGINRQDAFAHAAEAIRDRIHSGEIDLPLDDAIHSALLAADSRDGAAADNILAKLARGEIGLNIQPDPLLEVVVTLGKGKRKPWKFVTAEDVRDMTLLRRQNSNAARKSERRFLADAEAIYPQLIAAGTVGAMSAAIAA